MRCTLCNNGDRVPGRRPYVEQRGGKVAVVTDVPVCARTFRYALLTEMLDTETVAVRPFTDVESTAA